MTAAQNSRQMTTMISRPQFRGASATRVRATRRCLATIGGRIVSDRPDACASYFVTQANQPTIATTLRPAAMSTQVHITPPSPLAP